MAALFTTKIHHEDHEDHEAVFRSLAGVWPGPAPAEKPSDTKRPRVHSTFNSESTGPGRRSASRSPPASSPGSETLEGRVLKAPRPSAHRTHRGPASCSRKIGKGSATAAYGRAPGAGFVVFVTFVVPLSVTGEIRTSPDQPLTLSGAVLACASPRVRWVRWGQTLAGQRRSTFKVQRSTFNVTQPGLSCVEDVVRRMTADTGSGVAPAVHRQQR